MDASNTIPYKTFLVVVGEGGYFKPPNSKMYVRWGHPGFWGSMGACVPIEMRTHMIGLFPREGTGCCSCVVLIYSDPFYSSLKVKSGKCFKLNVFRVWEHESMFFNAVKSKIRFLTNLNFFGIYVLFLTLIGIRKTQK